MVRVDLEREIAAVPSRRRDRQVRRRPRILLTEVVAEFAAAAGSYAASSRAYGLTSDRGKSGGSCCWHSRC